MAPMVFRDGTIPRQVNRAARILERLRRGGSAGTTTPSKTTTASVNEPVIDGDRIVTVAERAETLGEHERRDPVLREALFQRRDRRAVDAGCGENRDFAAFDDSRFSRLQIEQAEQRRGVDPQRFAFGVFAFVLLPLRAPFFAAGRGR